MYVLLVTEGKLGPLFRGPFHLNAWVGGINGNSIHVQPSSNFKQNSLGDLLACLVFLGRLALWPWPYGDEPLATTRGHLHLLSWAIHLRDDPLCII